MSLGRCRVLISPVMSASLLAGLAVPESSGATTPDTTVPATGDGPVGLIAIGHSGLTGEHVALDQPNQDPLENSWATGTNPDVNSIYLRLIEVHPETEGHVANTAVGGGMASQLVDQAARALDDVPTPELVIIQTIDNDLNSCPVDEVALGQFGDSVTRALDVIVAASPQSRILIVGQQGREDPTYIEDLVAAFPEFKRELTGDGTIPCGGFFGPSGEVIEENFDELHNRIDAYEAEQQRRCDAVPQCRTDGGVRAAYVPTLEDLAPGGHQGTVRGAAKQPNSSGLSSSKPLDSTTAPIKP